MFSLKFRTIRTRTMIFFSWILVYKCCVFDWDFYGGNRTGGWGLKVWISSEKRIALFGILDCHESDAWIKIKGFLKESSSTNGRCSMETLVGGIITVVTEKYEFDYRNKTIKFNISWTIWLSGLWWKGHKYCFSTKSSSTNVRLSIGTLMEQINVIVVELVFKYR